MKIFIYLILFSVFLNASYQKSKEYYDSGMYQKAIAEAQKSYSEYGNEKLHLIWAKSAYELGYINEAMSAYERVLILDENNKEASFALLKIYSKTKREKLAQELIVKLESLKLSKSELKEIQKYKKSNLYSISFGANAGVGYDTNVNSSPDSTTFKKEESLFHRIGANVKYRNELKQRGAHYLEATFGFFYQNNIDASLYNMFLVNSSIGVGYDFNKFKVFVPLQISRLHFLDKDLYDQVSINPTISKKLNKNIFLSASTKHSVREYGGSDSFRDDKMHGIYLNGYYMLNRDYAYAKLSYETYKQDSSTITNYYIDKDVYSFTAGLNYHIDFQNIVAQAEYKHKYSSFKQRDDDFHQIKIRASKDINKLYNLFVSHSYAINNSTLSSADYEKVVLMFGISIRR